MEIDTAITDQVIERVEPALVGRSTKRLAVIGVVGLFAVFVASMLFRPPAGDYFTVCGFKNFTGLPCPGCGLTHSFCALGRGDVADAFGFNVLGPPLFLSLVLIWIRSVCVLLNRTDAVQLLDRIAGRFNVVRAFAIAFVVYGVARILYVIAFSPGTFNNSPLSHLIARLTH